MTVGELLARANATRVRVYIDPEGRLRADVPEDAPSEADTLVDALAARAQEVKAHLRAQAARQVVPDGTERVADGCWVPPFGQTWPSRWRDGRCVRCDGRRWRWSQDEGRWLCASCGVNDPDRPMPTRVQAVPEPAGHDAPDGSAGWPPECLASERLYGVRSARLYPLLGRRVTTPAGTGVLLQVFSSRVAVLVDGAVLHFKPEEVRP